MTHGLENDWHVGHRRCFCVQRVGARPGSVQDRDGVGARHLHPDRPRPREVRGARPPASTSRCLPSAGSAENVQRLRYEPGVKFALVQSDVYQAFLDQGKAGNAEAGAHHPPAARDHAALQRGDLLHRPCRLAARTSSTRSRTRRSTSARCAAARRCRRRRSTGRCSTRRIAESQRELLVATRKR